MNTTNQPLDILLNSEASNPALLKSAKNKVTHSFERENTFDRVLSKQQDVVRERDERTASGQDSNALAKKEPVAVQADNRSKQAAPAEDKVETENGKDLPPEQKVATSASQDAESGEIGTKEKTVELVLYEALIDVEAAEESFSGKRQTETALDETQPQFNTEDVDAEIEQVLSQQIAQASMAKNETTLRPEQLNVPELVRQIKTQLELAQQGRQPVPTALNTDADIELTDSKPLMSGIKLEGKPDPSTFSMQEKQQLLNLGQELKTLLKAGANEAPSAQITTTDAKENTLSRIQSLVQALQQANGQRSATGPAINGVTIQTAVQSPNWGQAVAQRIAWLAGNGVRAAELQLNPQELGPVSVKISVANDQANVSFTSQHASVREALETSISRLRESLENQGLNLADVDVSDHSLAREQTAEEETAGLAGTDAEAGSLESEEMAATQRIISDSLVDYYA